MLDSVAHPSRIRLIYECLPCAFLIEKAEGTSNDGEGKSVLDVPIKGYDQRISFFVGSTEEVDFVLETLKLKK